MEDSSNISDINSSQILADSENFEHVSNYAVAYITVINIAIFCAGFYGNIMVITVMIKIRSMRTSTNFYLYSLSMADMCVLLVCQPVAMMELFTKDRWYLGPVMCKIVPLLENGMLHVSILTMIAMTTERFYSIIYPLRSRTKCTEMSTLKIIIFLWIISFICTSPFLIITTLEDASFYDGSPAKVCRTLVHLVWHKVFIVTNNIVFFLLPFFVLTFMYSTIIRKLMSDSLSAITRNNKSASTTLRARKQAVRTLILIIILFFVSMCPIRVVTFWQIFTPAEKLNSIGIEAYYNILWFARIMMYINSAGNPIIYSLSSAKFKQAFRRVLGKCAV